MASLCGTGVAVSSLMKRWVMFCKVWLWLTCLPSRTPHSRPCMASSSRWVGRGGHAATVKLDPQDHLLLEGGSSDHSSQGMGGSLLFSSHVLLSAAWEGWLYPCPTSETDPQDLKAQKWRENETCVGSPKTLYCLVYQELVSQPVG